MTNTILFLVIIFVAIFVIKEFEKKTEGKDKYPYLNKKIMTPNEERFFKELVMITEEKYHVFPQVHLASFIRVEEGTLNWKKYFNKIIQKSVDFVVVDKETLDIKVAIELDDHTHSYWRRKIRDNFVENVFKTSGIMLFRTNIDHFNKDSLINLI